MRATEFISETIDITQNVTGHHGGQTDIQLVARTENGVAGYLDYSVWNGQVQIGMIHVHQKRSGVGTALVKALQKMYPTTEIDWGMTTPEGTQLYKSLEFEDIPNNSVIRKMKRLESLKAKNAHYEELGKTWEASNKTEQDRRAYLDATADWNDLYDEMHDLERDLHGEKPYRRLIKTD
jgi:hypothetical protein